MIIEVLKWDSEFFQKKIGKLVILNNNDFEPDPFVEKATREKFELIYIFKINSELKWDHVLKAKLELVDTHLTMSKKFNREEFHDTKYQFRTNLTENELNECYSIAKETSRVSRFYNERSIGSDKTEKLYKIWIVNALNKTLSDGLFLAKVSNSILGIHLIKTDSINKIGYFSLTGVKSENKGSGIGSSLWRQSFAYWANECDIEIIKSPFSFKNLESFNFHLKMGFNKIEECKYIYHWRNITIDDPFQ